MQFESIEAFVFDVDGTIYCQRRLRLRMFLSLVKVCCTDPKGKTIVRVLRSFRQYREQDACLHAETSLQSQYNWVAQRLGLKSNLVKDIVEAWMFRRPLKHLGACRYPGVGHLFAKLKAQGVKIGVFSDYPAREKLTAMGLEADCYLCATDNSVRQLKPSPKGLLHCCRQLNVAPDKALYIGDREELDGRCAKAARVSYFILPRNRGAVRKFYFALAEQL